MSASVTVDIKAIASPQLGYEEDERRPEILIYRKATTALLRRFLRISIETGRLPAVLKGMGLRSRLRSYPGHRFEDAVIFVADVERCLEELDPFARQVVARVVLQEFTEVEAAGLLVCCERTVRAVLAEALDDLAETFLRKGLLPV
jgi:hypothetical protein